MLHEFPYVGRCSCGQARNIERCLIRIQFSEGILLGMFERSNECSFCSICTVLTIFYGVSLTKMSWHLGEKWVSSKYEFNYSHTMFSAKNSKSRKNSVNQKTLRLVLFLQLIVLDHIRNSFSRCIVDVAWCVYCRIRFVCTDTIAIFCYFIC